MSRWWLIGLITWVTIVSIATAESEGPRRMRAAVPVLDVRAIPAPATPTLAHDPAQETQLLYGELVQVFDQRGDWTRIEAVEQAEWTHHDRWEGYPGWVETRGLVADDPPWDPNVVVVDRVGLIKSNPSADAPTLLRVSLGTRLVVTEDREPWWRVRLLDGREGWIRHHQAARLVELRTRSPGEQRQRILAAARQLVGTPYYWGGRSARLTETDGIPHTAVDCSGLVNLCYQAAGLTIPRDAHEQFLRARPIPLEDAQPGDLLFFADPKHPDQMTHVMLYAGNDVVIEGPGTGERVRAISLEEKLRAPASRGRRLVCGTYFP